MPIDGMRSASCRAPVAGEQKSTDAIGAAAIAAARRSPKRAGKLIAPQPSSIRSSANAGSGYQAAIRRKRDFAASERRNGRGCGIDLAAVRRIKRGNTMPSNEEEEGMAIGSIALMNLIVILVIGIVVGLVFNRYARSWLARLGTTTRSDITSALVGIAGAFIGFHLGVILGLLPTPLMLYLAAVIGAAVVLWLWRGR
jgi:uncharacterized membrane protein YeaQ/YmgE (transglycosylase-associated protein family)